MPILRGISQLITSERKRRGLKQETLGQMVGCTGSYITKVEKGTVIPSPILAMKLEKALRFKKGILTKSILEIRIREVNLKRQALANARLGNGYSAIEIDMQVPFYAAVNHKWTEDLERYIAIPKKELNGHKNFLIRAQDDCNNLAGINKGDILFAEIRQAKDGEYSIFCIGSNYFIKRYHNSKGITKMSPNSSNGDHKTTSHKHDRGIVWKGVVIVIYLKKV